MIFIQRDFLVKGLNDFIVTPISTAFSWLLKDKNMKKVMNMTEFLSFQKQREKQMSKHNFKQWNTSLKIKAIFVFFFSFLKRHYIMQKFK